MGKWEFILILVMMLMLLGIKGVFEGPGKAADSPGADFMLWVAQGFGIGRIPAAPGTFGSLLGILWFGLLVATGKIWVLAAGTTLGLALSVWLCDAAEKMLGQKDPGSVVLDEIAAMPVCFFSWAGLVAWRTGSLPGAAYFFSSGQWLLTLGIFAAFRFFDVLKPWPVRQSQRLRGGWGITVDDLLAAIYVNAVTWLVVGLRAWIR